MQYPRWGEFLFQNGAALTNADVTEMTLDTPEAREALELIDELYADGSMVSPTAVDAGWSGEAFGQGNAAMTIEGNWIVNFLADTYPDREVAYASLPTGPGRDPGHLRLHRVLRSAGQRRQPRGIVGAGQLPHQRGRRAGVDKRLQRDARPSLGAEPWLEGHPELEPFLAGVEYASKFQFIPGFGR